MFYKENCFCLKYVAGTNSNVPIGWVVLSAELNMGSALVVYTHCPCTLLGRYYLLSVGVMSEQWGLVFVCMFFGNTANVNNDSFRTQHGQLCTYLLILPWD